MSEAKHTPGPWTVAAGRYLIGPPLANSAQIAVLTKGDDWEAEMEANAHLIAAAPDLLAALRECRRELRYCMQQLSSLGRKSSQGGSVMSALAAGETAIAKAERRAKP